MRKPVPYVFGVLLLDLAVAIILYRFLRIRSVPLYGLTISVFNLVLSVINIAHCLAIAAGWKS